MFDSNKPNDPIPRAIYISTPEPSPSPAPPTLEAVRELLSKLSLKVPLPDELKQVIPIQEKLERITAEEMRLCDPDGLKRWPEVLADYGKMVADGDLAGARSLAALVFFPINERERHICSQALLATRAKLRGELVAITEKAFQRTVGPVSKALAAFEQQDKQYALEAGAETVQFRKTTITARAWPQHGLDAVNGLFREALASKK